ncbi:MAG: hypothetical protein Q8R26_02820 [bacterium]|nr:hypothetical protein [bacterium]
MFRTYFVPVGIIGLSALLQNTDALLIGGIKPNIVLAVVIALGVFVESFAFYVFLVLMGVVLLQTVPGFEKEIFVLAALLIGTFFIQKFLPWQQIINVIVLIIGATFIFYLVTYSSGFWPFALFESFYNIIFGSIWYVMYAAYKTRI